MAFAQLSTFLYANDREKSELNEILSKFDYDTFKRMQQEWLKSAHMVWYTHGNLSPDQARQIVDQAVSVA